MALLDFLKGNQFTVAAPQPQESQIKPINPGMKVDKNLFPPGLIDRLVFAESSGRPSATAIGSDRNSYKGLMGMGKVAWDEVNSIRASRGEPIHPFKKAYDPALNRAYGTTYMNERVPEILKSLNLPVNPLMGLILYGGWFKDMQKAKGDINKMPKNAQTYFRNVLGDGVIMFAPTIRGIYTSKLGSKK